MLESRLIGLIEERLMRLALPVSVKLWNGQIGFVRAAKRSCG